MNYRDEFKEIIEKITINSKTPQDEFNRQIQPLLQFLQKHVSAPLYKFRACTEDNFAAFDKDEIWLSKAANFNDLHDSLLFFDKPAMLEQVKINFSEDQCRAVFEKLKQSKNFLNQLRFQNPNMYSRLAEAIDKLDEKTFYDRFQHFLPNLDMLLDLCFNNLKEEIRNSVKMACFSGNISSPLMWAHYADNHKGFAIGYDFRGNQVSPCSNCPNRSCSKIKNAIIYPVMYSDSRYDATAYGKWYVEQYMRTSLGILPGNSYDDEFLYTKAALHKSNDWKYENEWRIICSTPDLIIENQNAYPIVKKPIAIYFGSQISDINRKLLTNIADNKGIAKYQMYVEDYSPQYELTCKPL